MSTPRRPRHVCDRQAWGRGRARHGHVASAECATKLSADQVVGALQLARTTAASNFAAVSVSSLHYLQPLGLLVRNPKTRVLGLLKNPNLPPNSPPYPSAPSTTSNPQASWCATLKLGSKTRVLGLLKTLISLRIRRRIRQFLPLPPTLRPPGARP
eukprot:1196311-Prorocentrum_minimum.AAC.3